ncbi:MAG: hypothetical protein JW708_03330 [Vallitaleaceae bacterium]|nr:hypothetical protein [Vallitaleaceae bacterium]
MFKKKDFELEIDKDVHLLVLDNKWHELFRGKKPPRIVMLENKINRMLMDQGKYNTEMKEYQQLKKKMMTDIMNNMDGASTEALKIMDKNRKYIDEINKKLEHHEKMLTELPSQISEYNKELVKATMSCFYKELQEVRKKSVKLDEEFLELKNKIKEMVVKKNETKEEYQKLYGYIHDVVGIQIIEQYDRYYNGEKND